MAGKNVVVEPPHPPVKKEELNLHYLQNSVLEHQAGEEVACDIMTSVVENATASMISNHFNRLAIPYTVRCVSKEILDFVYCAFVGQDEGHIHPPSWQPEGEYDQIQIDTWARAAIPTKHIKKEEKAKTVQLQMPTDGLGMTRRGVNPLFGGGQRLNATVSNLRAQKSGGQQAGELGRTQSRVSNLSGGAVRPRPKKQEDGDSSRKDSVVPGQEIDPMLILAPEDAEYTSKIEAEKQRRAEARQLAEKLSKQMDEMKGARDIVVDGPTGKVLAVRPVEGKTVQAVAKKSEMKFSVVSDSATAQSNVLGGPKSAPPAPITRKTLAGSLKKPRKDGSDFVQEEVTYGSMVETLIPSGGVSCRDGEKNLHSDLHLPKSKVSRSEYKKMVEVTQIEEGTISDAGAVEKESGVKPGGAQLIASPNSPLGGKSAITGTNNIVSQQQGGAQGGHSQPSSLNQHALSMVGRASDFKTQHVAELPQVKHSSDIPKATHVNTHSREHKMLSPQRQLRMQLAESMPMPAQKDHHSVSKVVVHQMIGDELDEDQ